MDFITHALVGTGVARLASPKREWIPQLSLAGILASEVQDADFWLYWIHPSYYGKYHRVASHNLWGLLLVALICAGLAWGITRVRPWRRFGWFVSDNLPPGSFRSPAQQPPERANRRQECLRYTGSPRPAENGNILNLPRADPPAPPLDHVPWRWFLLVAVVAAYLHLLFDTITGFGNIQPLWPWSAWDPSLAAVSSFDAVILATTVAWHVSLRYFNPPRKGEIILTAAYGVAMALYVGGRLMWCERTVW